ncbi:MAG TPA: hypothetical protein VJ437_10615 [Acidiferrobacterales bacterium]|nr:hypothetical protein [Acidiferrobacterales bacterium]
MKRLAYLVAGAIVFGAGPASAEMETRIIGDARGGVYVGRTDNRDGTETKVEDVRARLRVGLNTQFSSQWQSTVRFAGHYDDEMEEMHFSFLTTNESRPFGQSTFDMFNVQYTPSTNLEITVGRMQTKFELIGVAKKSLDRNDSPNVDIDFTDGLHASYAFESGWKTHLILQRNPDIARSELGVAPNVVRGPLDFTEDNSRVTTFIALENNTRSGSVVQRGIDLTIIPEALLVTGSATGSRENYLALVARTALGWPLGTGKQQFLMGAEIGYAPNTHMASVVNLPGSGDVRGYAWQTSLNLVEFAPGQSVALVWGEAQAGWLISPDFRENERLVELRHRYIITRKLSVESRIRQRQELEQLTTAIRKRDAQDLYVRLSYKFH